MGLYLNPGNDAFRQAVTDDIYIDKTEMISLMNRKLDLFCPNLMRYLTAGIINTVSGMRVIQPEIRFLFQAGDKYHCMICYSCILLRISQISSAVSAIRFAPFCSRNSRSRNPQLTLMQGIPAFLAVARSTSESPT